MTQRAIIVREAIIWVFLVFALLRELGNEEPDAAYFVLLALAIIGTSAALELLSRSIDFKVIKKVRDYIKTVT